MNPDLGRCRPTRFLSSMLGVCLLLAQAVACLVAPTLAASDGEEGPDPATRLTVEHFLDMERVSDPQLSPDGRHIVYTRSWVDPLEDRWQPELWIMDSDGSRQRFLTRGSQARWSPDGNRIAYLGEGEPEGTQLYVRWMDAEGATSQVTRVTQTPRDFRWSPDGESLAFLMLVPSQNTWKIDMPTPPEGAKWTEPPRLVERMHYRQDRRGFMEQGFLHLFTVPANGGTPRQLTSGDWHVGFRGYGLDFGASISWTPDGEEILIDGLDAEDADVRYRESHIYAVNVKTREMRQLTQDKGPWNTPLVSPDGRTVAFLGHPWTRQTYHTEQIYVMDIAGGEMRSLTPGIDRDPEDLHWAKDGSGLYFVARDRGSANVRFVSTLGDGVVGIESITEGNHMLSLSSVSKRWAVGVRSGPHEPTNIVRFRRSRPEIEQLTRINEDVLASIELGEVEELWYESSDGTPIQGWLVKPPDFNPALQYPLILHIHGGPHAMYSARFSYSFQNFAAHGYLVLYTNPRGSTGYGTDFGNAIDSSYPSVDFHDLMAGVDTIVARGYVDESRMHVTGTSGGGVLSSWIVGHDHRFASAAVRAPVVNWISFAGTTDITAWGFHRYERSFWEDPDTWLNHSPLMHADKVKTPVLLMTGELDLRTPMGQSEEYYQALKTLGVETKLLRFHGEYHGTGSKPSNFMRTQLYLMSWFEQHDGSGVSEEEAEVEVTSSGGEE